MSEQELLQSLLSINTLMQTRLEMAQAFGQKAYGGERDYYTALGYPRSLGFSDFNNMYRRQDIARRIVDIPAQDTWKKPPSITEDGNTETQFVKDWLIAAEALRIFSVLSRLDKLAGIGRYGVLFIGANDGLPTSEPLEATLGGPKDLLFLRPFAEGSAIIKTSEQETSSPRYGLPLLYTLKVDGADDLDVHWTRIIHVAGDLLESEVFGIPRLEIVFNRCLDILKVVGGSAEATWLNMRPGTVVTTQPGYEFKSDDESSQALQTQIEEYLHGLARMMTVEGVDVKTIAGQMLDPTGAFEVQLRLIAAATGIPMRVLEGSAAGELSAAKEDTKQWYSHISWRQINYAEPRVLRALIDRLIGVRILTPPADMTYDVGEQDDDGNWTWPPLYEMSDEEMATIASTRASAISTLGTPITESEKRQVLGFPKDYPEGEEPTRKPTPEPSSEELPAQDIDPDQGVASQIKSNVVLGLVSPADYREWLVTELSSLAQEDSDG